MEARYHAVASTTGKVHRVTDEVQGLYLEGKVDYSSVYSLRTLPKGVVSTVDTLPLWGTRTECGILRDPATSKWQQYGTYSAAEVIMYSKFDDADKLDPCATCWNGVA